MSSLLVASGGGVHAIRILDHQPAGELRFKPTKQKPSVVFGGTFRLGCSAPLRPATALQQLLRPAPNLSRLVIDVFGLKKMSRGGM